jgi:DNA-directed RNA polymerase subunit RPC12/RpoP
MDNKLYRIEVLMHDNLPTIDTAGILTTNEGLAFVKLHPVKIKATPKNKTEYGNWMVGLDGSYMCSECGRIFRYEIGNYCSNCGARLEYEEDGK